MDKLEICNLALSHIYKNPLVNFDNDTTTEAKVCRQHFQPFLDLFTSSIIWESLTEFITLSKFADIDQTIETENPFKYRYHYPTEIVRMISINNYTGTGSDPFFNRKRIGTERYIDTNEASPRAYVVKRVTDPLIMDDHISYAFSYYFALHIYKFEGMSSGSSSSLEARLEREYKKARNMAANLELLQNNRGEQEKVGDVLRARVF